MEQNNSTNLPSEPEQTNQQEVNPPDVDVQIAVEQDNETQLQQVVEENSPEPSVLKRFMKSARDKYDSIPDAWGQIRTNPEEKERSG